MTVTLALRDPCCDKGSIPNKFSSPGEGHRPNTNSVHCNIYQVCGLAPWHTSQEVEVEEEEQYTPFPTWMIFQNYYAFQPWKWLSCDY